MTSWSRSPRGRSGFASAISGSTSAAAPSATPHSVFVAFLRGELHADKGDVEFPGHWRIAHVAQETPALERPAVEYAIDGDTALRNLEQKLLLAESVNDGNLIGELHARLADADVYTVRSRAEQLLLGLGFSKQNLNE